MTNTRPPAVAGMFYPGDPGTLSATVDQLLADARNDAATQPKALIVPHAGYVYSGSTAAIAYATLAPWAKTINRVILLGPTHRVSVNGITKVTDSALGAIFGGVEAILIVSAAIVIVDTYLGTNSTLRHTLGPGLLKTFTDAFNGSTTVHLLRDTTVPVVLSILGPLLPKDISTLLPAGLPTGIPGGFPLPTP